MRPSSSSSRGRSVDARERPCRGRCYGARTSGRSPWGGDTARRRFIGGGRGRFFHNSVPPSKQNRLGTPPRTMCNVRPFNQLVPRLPTGDLFGPIYSERALRLFGKGTDARATASRTLAGRPRLARGRPARPRRRPRMLLGRWPLVLAPQQYMNGCFSVVVDLGSRRGHPVDTLVNTNNR